MENKKTLSIIEMAKTLGISKSLAYDLVNSGEIRSIRLGVKRIIITATELDRLLTLPDLTQEVAANAQN